MYLQVSVTADDKQGARCYRVQQLNNTCILPRHNYVQRCYPDPNHRVLCQKLRIKKFKSFVEMFKNTLCNRESVRCGGQVLVHFVGCSTSLVSSLKFKSNLLMKRVFFLSSAAFAVAILDLISHLSSFLIMLPE